MASAPTPELSLVYQHDGEPAVFPIPEGTTTLGSARDNDLILRDPTVKPHQVVLMRDGDVVELRDLFAGLTRVNEEERMSGPLLPGDVLCLGQVRLRVMKVALSSSGRVERVEVEVPEAPADAVPDDSAGPQEMPWPATVEAFDVSARSDESDRKLRELRKVEARRAKALGRARQLSEELAGEVDFHELLEQLVHGLLDTFVADRAVTVLFEEDGRNPLLTVERCRDGSNQGEGIAEEIVERCLQVRTVLRIAGGSHGLGGLAAPLLFQGRVLGLIYFERTAGGAAPFEAEDVHLTAMIANQAALVLGPQIMEG